MITAVSRIFVALMGTGYDAKRPYVEFRDTKLTCQLARPPMRDGWIRLHLQGAPRSERTASPDRVRPDTKRFPPSGARRKIAPR